MPDARGKVIAIIQARIGSRRLPGKILKKICGRTLLEWIYYRLSFCQEIDKIVLSTSDSEENKELLALAGRIGLDSYAGSEIDLVDRIYRTAENFNAQAIVRITGDCPFVDPAVVDSLVRIYRQKAPTIDYVCNVLPPTFPDGLDVEVISLATLRGLFDEVKDPLYREWITITILENPNKFRIFNVKREPSLAAIRLTVDYPEDFELTERIIKNLHQEGKVFCLDDILKLFKSQPELLEINKNRVDMTIVNNIRSQAFADAKNNQ